jgi:glycosyltransferase involved in cell wall biosynthesis
LEAFACGKPVIGSRIGGIPELVKDYETGLLFEPGNVDDLYLKIQYLIENPIKAVQWGKRGMDFLNQNLGPEIHYQKLMEIYRRVCSYIN